MAYARQCDRCKRIVAPRGDSTPRFCPVCGFPLRGGPVELVGQPGRDVAGTSNQARASFILGIVSLPVFVCGLPLGLLAIVFGLSAKGRIRASHGRLGGDGLATAGITLGIIGCILQLLICLGAA